MESWACLFQLVTLQGLSIIQGSRRVHLSCLFFLHSPQTQALLGEKYLQLSAPSSLSHLLHLPEEPFLLLPPQVKTYSSSKPWLPPQEPSLSQAAPIPLSAFHVPAHHTHCSPYSLQLCLCADGASPPRAGVCILGTVHRPGIPCLLGWVLLSNNMLCAGLWGKMSRWNPS